jgi:hypothetical protein
MHIGYRVTYEVGTHYGWDCSLSGSDLRIHGVPFGLATYDCFFVFACLGKWFAIILKTEWRSPTFLLLSWNMDSCVSAHPAVNEWGGMKLGQSSTYYPRIWIAVSPSNQRCMCREDHRTCNSQSWRRQIILWWGLSQFSNSRTRLW